MGTGNRRYLLATDGQDWTLDLSLTASTPPSRLSIRSRPPTLDEAKRMAQEWESGLW